MGKNKRRHKKHSFKHAAPSTKRTVESETQKSDQPTNAAAGRSGSPEFAYVATDLRKIGILAAAFVLLQIVLWYAFNYTGLGASVYSLIKL